jgi:hypothetical protein
VHAFDRMVVIGSREGMDQLQRALRLEAEGG